MRRPLMCFFVSLACFAQVAKPMLTFKNQHHDFGKIPEDKEVRCKFKATNETTGIINVWKLVPSCGCITLEISKNLLPPGDSTEIDLTFNPLGKPGLQRKSVKIFYEVLEMDEEKTLTSTAQITFGAEVIPEIALSKATLFFEDVDRTASKNDSVRLRSGKGEPVKILDVAIVNAPYLLCSQRIEGKDALLEVAFDAKRVPAGKFSGSDTIKIKTSNQKSPEATVDVKWNLLPLFTTTPARLSWTGTPGKELKTSLLVKHAKGRFFKVLEAKSSNTLLKVEGVGQKAAPQQELTVHFSDQAKVGTYLENLQLTLDEPEQSSLEIRVSALIK